MGAKKVLHMNAGDGENSYANNSTVQKIVTMKARRIVDETLKDMYDNEAFPDCFKLADLGCSCGPNTLFVTSNIIDTVKELCQQNNHKVPEFQVYLNDLPDNDFNTLFKLLKREDKLGPCFVSGVPGSFYNRLFPSNSLHFVHSSYSVHWLSQLPEGLEDNRRNVYVSKTSPPHVFEKYLKQYQRDFSLFLSLRSEEIVAGGRMVLTFIARSVADPSTKDCAAHYTLLAKSLLDMVTEGLIKEADLFSFNTPVYFPYKDEVKAIIQKEGSFNLERLESFEVSWDASECDNDPHFVFDKYRSGKIVANCVRAFMEQILASHFGDSIVDNLFSRYANNVAEHISMEKSHYFNIVISLTKK